MPAGPAVRRTIARTAATLVKVSLRIPDDDPDSAQCSGFVRTHTSPVACLSMGVADVELQTRSDTAGVLHWMTATPEFSEGL
jgi:hypothetical protein